MDRAAIVQSLELVAECGDPAPLVYARVFELHPQMRQLFVRDTDGSNLMRSEIVNHENLGVPPDVFVSFFTTVRDVFAQMLGADWSAAMGKAWAELLDRIATSLAAR